MFVLEDTKPETFSGEIGRLLKAISAIETHTKKKRELLAQLELLCKKNSYIIFGAYSHRFHIDRVGQSYLYDVPVNKRGHLQPFRGKTIRLICIESGSNWNRAYMAGVYPSQTEQETSETTLVLDKYL